jgi:hypothetical protein
MLPLRYSWETEVDRRGWDGASGGDDLAAGEEKPNRRQR